jgi:hypothetical protein
VDQQSRSRGFAPLLFTALLFNAAAPSGPALASPDGRRAPENAAPALAFFFGALPDADPDDATCSPEMVLVEGMYCPSLKQTCLKWVDPPTSAYPNTRCAEWKEPATCEGERVHKRYCVDREEFIRPPETLPIAHVSWTEAEALCEEKGARLCTEAEWEFACEGEAGLPYPYGYKRDSNICNFDRTDLGKMGEGLTDHRAPPDAFPECVSPFGIHNMVGNVDEWTWREGMNPPYRSALHGGWWLPGRNNCRQATLAHAENYFGPQVGFRCCRDARQ